MKTAFKFLFVTGLVLAFFVQSPELGAISVVGFALTSASYHTKLAMFTLVPAVVRDLNPTAPEVPPFSRAQKFLFDFLRNKGNMVTYKAFLDGTIFFDPINYYVRSVIPGAQQGRYQILGPNTSQIVGETNFYAQAILPQYYNFCFDRLQVNYGSTNTANAVVQAISGWTNVRGSMPAALGNGDLIVQLNKNIILQSGICDFTSEAAVVGGSSLDFAGGNLQVPRVLQENLTVEGDVNFALGQAMLNVANTTYGVEVLFKGVQLRLR